MGLFPLCNGFAAGPKFTTYYGGIQLRLARFEGLVT